MKNNYIKNIVLSGLFIALGLVLPFLTGQIPEIGKMLCPMHIPVIICGFVCGWPYGLIVGAITPLLRSLIFLTPVMYPHAISMAFELAAYGFFCGLIFNLFKKKNLLTIYISLISSMVLGRIIKGIATYILLMMQGNKYTMAMFISGAITTAIPGIILQLVLIPILLFALIKTKLIKYE